MAKVDVAARQLAIIHLLAHHVVAHISLRHTPTKIAVWQLVKAHHHAAVHHSALAAVVKFLIVQIPSDLALRIDDEIFGEIVPASSTAVFPIKRLINARYGVVDEIEPVFKGGTYLFDLHLLHVAKSIIAAIRHDRLGVNFILFDLLFAAENIAYFDLV